MNENDPTVAELKPVVAELSALVAQLSARIQTLEQQAAQWHPEVSEEVLLAISAACAAYLGKRGTIKQVHLRRGGGWAAQGRVAAQQSHSELHGYGERQAPLTQIPRRGTT
jgi:methylmalonyl-CoA carboxyltransferase large subunit